MRMASFSSNKLGSSKVSACSDSYWWAHGKEVNNLIDKRQIFDSHAR